MTKPGELHHDGVGAFSRATGRAPEESARPNQQHYLSYQHELIARQCGSSVLEVGAGLGDLADLFEGLDGHIVTDVDPAAVALLRRRFADRGGVEARQLDLRDTEHAGIAQVSTVVAVNVLEHIEDDCAALRALARLVVPGGRLVLWVPGYPRLYGEFDRRVGHVRRYTPAALRSALVDAGLAPVEVRPVNLLGGIAWWLIVRHGGVSAPRPRLVRLYDRTVVPLTRAVERRITPPFGQSLLAAAIVPGPD